MYPISGWNCKAFCVVFQEIYAADKKFTRPSVPLVPPNINSAKNMALNTRKYEIFSLNCRSINRNWKSLKVLLLPCIPNCKILALSETWLNVPETVDARRQQEENYALDGYKVCLTNHGKGKGLATYYKADEFQLIQEINQYAIQIVKLRCNQFDFIHVYRSKSYSFFSWKFHS